MGHCVPDTPHRQEDNHGPQLSLCQDLLVRPGQGIDGHLRHNPSNEKDVQEHLGIFLLDVYKIRHIAIMQKKTIQ